MPLDKFGCMLRDVRLTRSLLLYDMANDLGMSSAELSAIETGKKPVPDWLFEKLKELYGIGEFYSRLLQAAAEERKHHPYQLKIIREKEYRSIMKTIKKKTNSNSAISSYISRVRYLLSEGATPSQIAKAMNKPLGDVRVWIKAVKDIDKRTTRIIKMRKKGMPIKDIAKAEGVSESTVRRTLQWRILV